MPSITLKTADGVTEIFTFDNVDTVDWNFQKVGLNDYNILGGIRPEAYDDSSMNRTWVARGKLVADGSDTPLSLFNEIDTQIRKTAGSFMMVVFFPRGEGAAVGSYVAVVPGFQDGVNTGGGVAIKDFSGQITGAPQYVPYTITFTEVARIN